MLVLSSLIYHLLLIFDSGASICAIENDNYFGYEEEVRNKDFHDNLNYTYGELDE